MLQNFIYNNQYNYRYIFCRLPLFFIFFTYLISASYIETEKKIKFFIDNTTQKEYTVYKGDFENKTNQLFMPSNITENMPSQIQQQWNIDHRIITMNYENNVIDLKINGKIIEESMLDLIFNLLDINKKSDLLVYDILEKQQIETLHDMKRLGNVLLFNDNLKQKIELHIMYKQNKISNTSDFELSNDGDNDKISFAKEWFSRKDFCVNQFYGILLLYKDTLQKSRFHSSPNTVDFSFLQEANNFNKLCTFEKYKKIYTYLSKLELFPKKNAVTDVIVDLFRLEIYDPHKSFLYSLRKQFKNLKQVYISSNYIGIVRNYKKLHFLYHNLSTDNNKYSGNFNPLTIYVADTQQSEELLKSAFLFYYKYHVLESNLFVFTCIKALSMLSLEGILIFFLDTHNSFRTVFSFVFVIVSLWTIERTKQTGCIDTYIYSNQLKKFDNDINKINWEKVYQVKPALVYALPMICYVLYLIIKKITFNMYLKELLLNKQHAGELLLFIALQSLNTFHKTRFLYRIKNHNIFKSNKEYCKT